MAEHNHSAAANALINWFQSQDIMPADAELIMSKVIATQLVSKSRNLDNLHHAVILYRDLLAFDIADCLNDR